MFFALKKKITSFVKAFYFIFFKVHLLFWSHNILGDVRFNMGFLFTLQTHRKSFEKKKNFLSFETLLCSLLNCISPAAGKRTSPLTHTSPFDLLEQGGGGQGERRSSPLGFFLLAFGWKHFVSDGWILFPCTHTRTYTWNPEVFNFFPSWATSCTWS